MQLNWGNAKIWLEKVNEGKDDFNEPKWDWDCGFKLDFDGSVLSVSSRFYPPNKNFSKLWEGSVEVLLLNTEISTKEFKCELLDDLKNEVESYVKSQIEIIKTKLLTQ